MASSLPDHASLLRELKEVRRAGLVRLRGRELPALESVAQTVTAPGARAPGAAVETLLRLAVTRLDAGTLRTAAEYTLGLAQGTRDWPASSRRARAASVYGVSVERFRKDHEVMVLGQVAEHVLRLAAEAAAEPGAVVAEEGVGTHRTVRVRAGERPVTLTLHVHPVDLLRDVDVVVSPSNVHFALPERYKSSVAASLRRAASVRGVTGDVLDDPVHDELTKWASRHGTSGRAVLPGTVAATGAGPWPDRAYGGSTTRQSPSPGRDQRLRRAAVRHHPGRLPRSRSWRRSTTASTRRCARCASRCSARAAADCRTTSVWPPYGPPWRRSWRVGPGGTSTSWCVRPLRRRSWSAYPPGSARRTTGGRPVDPMEWERTRAPPERRGGRAGGCEGNPPARSSLATRTAR
ncbi:hypothetical protein O1M54_14350 [Streptomyces diastatochromogenes]|nr:hypothetical protein [Streptomyces diastatochromogenes]